MSDLHNNFLSVEIRTAVLCDSCNNAIPVNGVVSKVKCGQCQELTELSGRLRWPEVLNYQNPKINIFKATLKHKPGKGDYGAWRPVKLNTKRIWPICPKCDHKYDPETVIKHAEDGKNLQCVKCNTHMSVQKPPDLISKPFPFIKYIIGGTAQEIGAISNQELNKGTAKPVVMACMACGGTLTVDGTKRLVECKFCQSSNYLPDDLWLSLHPAPKRTPWYVVFGTTAINKK